MLPPVYCMRLDSREKFRKEDGRGAAEGAVDVRTERRLVGVDLDDLGAGRLGDEGERSGGLDDAARAGDDEQVAGLRGRAGGFERRRRQRLAEPDHRGAEEAAARAARL